jgi:hypothetical protein
LAARATEFRTTAAAPWQEAASARPGGKMRKQSTSGRNRFYETVSVKKNVFGCKFVETVWAQIYGQELKYVQVCNILFQRPFSAVNLRV